MKKINVFLVVLAVFLSPLKFVQAESSCSYSEQVEFNNLAANIRATYEAVDIYYGKAIDIDGTGEEVDVYSRGLKISILNITDDIYIKVKNTITEEEKTYYYKDTIDGVLTFDTDEVDEVTAYQVEIYANKYSCINELYRVYSFTTPRYNSYSKMEICKDNPGFYYCQEFVQSKEIDINTFYKNLDNYKIKEEEKIEEESKTFWDRIKEFYGEHALVINLTASVIIIAGVTTTVILVKKRRSRVL